MMPCVTQYWMPGYAQFFVTSVNICVTSTSVVSFHVALRTLSVELTTLSPAGYTSPFTASQPANSLPSGGVKVHSGSVKFSPDLTFMGCIVPVPPLGSKEMVISAASLSFHVALRLWS